MSSAAGGLGGAPGIGPASKKNKNGGEGGRKPKKKKKKERAKNTMINSVLPPNTSKKAFPTPRKRFRETKYETEPEHTIFCVPPFCGPRLGQDQQSMVHLGFGTCMGGGGTSSKSLHQPWLTIVSVTINPTRVSPWRVLNTSKRQSNVVYSWFGSDGDTTPCFARV